MVKFINFGLILLNIGLAVSGQMLIKMGMKQVGYITSDNLVNALWRAMLNPLVMAGLIFYFIAAFVWILVLSRVDLSYAYPMLSLGYIVILIISATILHEPVSLSRMFGTSFIILGVILIFYS